MRWWAALSALFAPSLTLAAPPVIDPLSVDVGEGDTVVLSPTVNDPDGDPLSLSWDLDGDGAYDDSNEPAPTWSAAGIDGPQLGISVRFIVSDGENETEGWVNVDVLNVPPLVDDAGGFRLEARRPWVHPVPVHDVEVDTVTVETWGDVPTGLSLEQEGFDGVLSWTPTESQIGEHEIRIRAEDDDGAATLRIIDVTVFENTPPPTPDISAVIVNQTAAVTLSHVDDPDGDPVQVFLEMDSDPCFCTNERQESFALNQGPSATEWSSPRPLDVVNHQTYYLRRWASDGLDDSESALSLVEVPPSPGPEYDAGVSCADADSYSEGGGCCERHSYPCRIAGPHDTPVHLSPFVALVLFVLVRSRRRR